jgi:hypothetical protein
MNANPKVVLVAPYAQIHITGLDLIDHISMRSEQLAGVLALMGSDPARIAGNLPPLLALILMAKNMADELAAFVAEIASPYNIVGSAPFMAGQLADLLSLIQGEGGPDVMLWHCQQLADELVGALRAMNAQANVEVSA